MNDFNSKKDDNDNTMQENMVNTGRILTTNAFGPKTAKLAFDRSLKEIHNLSNNSNVRLSSGRSLIEKQFGSDAADVTFDTHLEKIHDLRGSKN